MEKFRVVNFCTVNVDAIVTKQYQPKAIACLQIVKQPFFGEYDLMKTKASFAGMFHG